MSHSYLLLAIALCACAANRPRSSADGTLLDEQPCALPKPHAQLIAEWTAGLRPEFERSKLLAEFDAHPLDGLLTAEEYRSLQTEDGCRKIHYRSDGLRIAGYVVRPAA